MTAAAMQALGKGDLSALVLVQNGHGGESDGADGIQAARALLAKLDDELQADVGAAFSPEIIDALGLVQERDPPAWARAKQILQKRKVSVKDIQGAISSRTPQLLELPDQHGERAGDVLPGCPAPGMRLPKGFALDREGTWEWNMGRDPFSGGSKQRVAHSPILISARFRNIETGAEALRIHWGRPDGWRALTVDRSVALDARRILELAGDGFPVFSDNARKLTKYLAEAEALNWSTLPTTHVSAHLGWQGRDGEHGFVVGRALITSGGESIETPRSLGLEGKVMPASCVSFRGLTAGDEQIVDAYHAHGNKEEWVRAIAKLEHHPRVMVALYASFVPPLLTIIRCPNFIIDWAYRTSAGKTTLLRMAASVWGNPNENEPDAAMRSWDSTQVYIERAASILSGLPLILDETKRVKDPRVVASVLYEVATGQGRGRGNVKSTAGIRTWRTVLLSTGEAPVVSYTQDGGTRARCLEIRGAPFGKTNADTAKMVQELNLAIKANYGHAGVELVRWLTRHRSDWPRLEGEYQSLVRQYCQRAPANSDPAVVSRLAQYAAALGLAAVYAHVALDLPWEFRDPMDELWSDLIVESSDAPGEERALRDVISWAYAHAQTFDGRHFKGGETNGEGQSLRMPPGGWSGRWDSEDWKYIGFLPPVLNKVLVDLGYTPDAILAGWKERGWLLVDNDRIRNTTRQRMLDDRPHLVAIKREAVQAAEGPEEEEFEAEDKW